MTVAFQSQLIFLSENFLEAFVAIWLFVLFLKSALVELFQTEGAHKVFRMELLEHGSNAATYDGFRAAGTEGATLSMVMCLTVGQTFVIKERAALEGPPAILEIVKEIICYNVYVHMRT